jgi:signal transduction histidine kinase
VLLIGLAWNPRSGVAGLNVFFARYIFSIGLPVEKWLRFLAELLQMEARPERFLVESVAALVRLPSISGVAWRTAEATGEEGTPTPDVVEFENSALALKLYSRHRLGPALHWHLHLLGQVLGEFYVAKLREEKLRQASYVQAVHETGARMTHDIKNLLQSLNVLCAVAGREGNRDSPELQALVRRQLPLIAQRLTETLARLQQPREQSESYAAAQAWWDALAHQYRRDGVAFEPARLPPAARIPRTLFDSVADNLLSNALAKRAVDGTLRIEVTLEHDGRRIALRVKDSGSAVPDAIESQLLRGPVPSERGLGIGLYQAARQAEAAGYSLSLETNRDGEVCFALQGPAA